MMQKITFTEATQLIKSAATSLQKDIMSELKAFGSNDGKVIYYKGNTKLPEQ